MDPTSGQLWNEEQLQDLEEISPEQAKELKERLVQVEGKTEHIEELSHNVQEGALARKEARNRYNREHLRRT